jgi:hypothetical protein
MFTEHIRVDAQLTAVYEKHQPADAVQLLISTSNSAGARQ